MHFPSVMRCSELNGFLEDPKHPFVRDIAKHVKEVTGGKPRFVRGATRRLIDVGCQIIRYGDLERVDDAENPRKLDDLIGALGAGTVDYAETLDCCGSGLMRGHSDSALSLAGSKLKTVQNLAVDGLVVSCPDCQLMFDARQKDAGTTVGAKLSMPVVYYTQLLGLALNIGEKRIGLNLNQSTVINF